MSERRERLVIERGGIYWVELGEPHGSRPGKRRPVLVVQSSPHNTSRLGTVIVVIITSNTSLAAIRGNVFLPASATGLPKDSTAKVTCNALRGKARRSAELRFHGARHSLGGRVWRSGPRVALPASGLSI